MDCMCLSVRRCCHAAAMLALRSVMSSLCGGGQAEEARKRAGFAVKETEQPAWMRKPGSGTSARPAPQHGMLHAVLPHVADCRVGFTWLPSHQLARQCVGHLQWGLSTTNAELTLP